MEEYFRIYTLNEIAVVEILGERLDLFRSPDLAHQVESYIKDSGCANVVFDLNKLSYIDSSGFGFMVSIRNLIRHKGGMAAIASDNPLILHVLKLMNIQVLFPVYATAEEAVKGLNKIIFSGNK